MPSQPPQPRKWEDIPWNERNILSKILYVIFCIISGLFGCLILLFIVCINWGLLQGGFHMLDKAFGGSISATAGSIWDVLRQINWWLYPIFIVAYCNRWLRTVSLILTGGVVGYFINPSIGFWAGAGISAFASLLCALTPRRTKTLCQSDHDLNQSLDGTTDKTCDRSKK